MKLTLLLCFALTSCDDIAYNVRAAIAAEEPAPKREGVAMVCSAEAYNASPMRLLLFCEQVDGGVER